MGFDGPTGLDYSVLFQMIKFYDIKDEVKVFEGVRLMETTVLNHRQKGK